MRKHWVKIMVVRHSYERYRNIIMERRTASDDMRQRANRDTDD
jgi:hypothetical protein